MNARTRQEQFEHSGSMIEDQSDWSQELPHLFSTDPFQTFNKPHIKQKTSALGFTHLMRAGLERENRPTARERARKWVLMKEDWNRFSDRGCQVVPQFKVIVFWSVFFGCFWNWRTWVALRTKMASLSHSKIEILPVFWSRESSKPKNLEYWIFVLARTCTYCTQLFRRLQRHRTSWRGRGRRKCTHEYGIYSRSFKGLSDQASTNRKCFCWCHKNSKPWENVS